MIKQIGSKWVLFTKDGSRRLGTHATKAEAIAQEQAILHSQARAAEERHVHLLTAAAPVREAMYDGRPHLVVPIVALMEGVIRAINAGGPEYVPSQFITATAHTWNGRPLVLGHPTKNGLQISANEPSVWESQGIGRIFNARALGSRLTMDGYVDILKLEALGQQDLLAKIRAGDPVEVSVGSFVRTANEIGRFAGQTYGATWRDGVGDHLAFLPKGVGACSLSMGCGANRSAEDAPAVYAVTDTGWREIAPGQQQKGAAMMNELKARILALFDTPEEAASEEAAELVGYSVIRTHLDALGKSWDAASAIVNELIADETENPTETSAEEDAEEEVESARLDALMSLLGSMASTASLAMSVCMDSNAPDTADMSGPPRYMEGRAAVGKEISAKNLKTIQSAHDAAHAMHDQTVNLGADCPGGMKTAEVELKAACGCKGDDDMNRTERIAALAKHDHNPIKDVKTLDGLSDDALKTLEDHASAITATMTAAHAKLTETEAALKAAQAAQIPADELAHLRALAAEKQADDAKQKTDLVGSLKAAQTAFTEDELNAKAIPELLKLAAMVKIPEPVDYRSRGYPVPRAAETPKDDFTPPNPYDAGLKVLQGESKATH